MGQRYTIDAAGVDLIISFEGWANGVYNDYPTQYATCGFGHLLHESPATAADHAEYDNRGRAFFLNLLQQDIQRVSIGPMNAILRVALNQNEVNATACLCFNTGPGAIQGTVGRDINARNWQAAADAFLLWAHPSELLPRRETERKLFLTPMPPKFPWLQPVERTAVLEYDKLDAHPTAANAARRKVLVAAMRTMRIAVHHAAGLKGNGGWDIDGRRQRYHTLLLRTES